MSILNIFIACMNYYCCSLAVQKHCILVCNSAPYAMVSQESRNYSGMTTDQLVSCLAEVSYFIYRYLLHLQCIVNLKEYVLLFFITHTFAMIL